MNVIFFDLATATGWASYYHGTTESGVEKFTLRPGESPGMRFLRFNRWLSEVLLDGMGENPCYDLVVYEKPLARQSSSAAAAIAYGFATRVQEFCARRDIEHSVVPAGTLKKHATGKGNASKAMMMAAAQALFPDQDVTDENQGDALCGLHFVIQEYAPALAAGAAEGKG